MSIVEIISIVFPVFAVTGVGYIFANYKEIDLVSITEIILYLGAPCLALSSLIKKSVNLKEFFTISFSCIAVVIVSLILVWLFVRIKKIKHRGFYLPVLFMNSGNMGLPICLLAFGEEGLSKAIVYYVTASLLSYSLGVYIAKGKGKDSFNEIFKLPLIYAFTLGIIISYNKINIPKTILVPIDMIGQVTVPLMLFSLGYKMKSVIADFKSTTNSISLTFIGSFMRIGFGFAIAIIIVSLLSVKGITKGVILLESSMPSAVINFIFSEKYDANPELVASIILMTTILSIVTIPLILLVVK